MALDYRLGNKRSHELPLLREQESYFHKGDIFIGDKSFICFYDQARLLEQGVDSIFALVKRIPVCAKKAIKKISNDDLIISVPKFTITSARKRYPENAWDTLPDNIAMRQIKVKIAIPGYRVQSIYLLTILLDSDAYSPELIADLYRQRWRIEVFFRDIKTTLKMEMLRGKTPDTVRKEIQLFFLKNNIIRLLIIDSQSKQEWEDKSFKSSAQLLIAYSEKNIDMDYRSAKVLLKKLITDISEYDLMKRLRRIKTRVVK